MTQRLGLGLMLLNKVAGLLRRHSFFDPRPFLWNLAMLAYFVVSIIFLLLLPLSLPYSPPVDLLLGLIGFPGLIYSFLSLQRLVMRRVALYYGLGMSWGFASSCSCSLA